ncbi:membrane protein [Iodidimonas gelatinilytica]|uniref:Membrane protein n=1 Tax=Iodidimonas gelatinilytica TaxID=1236966 RepID=A0A5A7MWS5_9PROT|nr:saccharopine dehydrogenase NADP-binding domain-containing protein [Iodidimonas gelatinilytica]GEQ99305.1 membrane protein [Iodidimonas gelatinilytica]
MTVLIYGVTGYTGQLVAEEAAKAGLSPIVAGRNEEKTRAIAERHGFDWTAFSLDETEKLRAALQDVDSVLHLAGPFSATSKPMADACIETGTHYLDITGEIDVFEALAARNAEAKAAGVMLMPGCGFDVVPSDCLAAHMKTRLPDATSLELVITGLNKMSRGTAKTGIEGLKKSRRARRYNCIVDLDQPEEKAFHFPDGSTKQGISVSWGDVSTAWHSTGIPDITVFFEKTGALKQMAKMGPLMRWLLSTAPAQAFLKRKIDQRPAGPTAEERMAGRAHMLGIVKNAAGETRRTVLTTPEGYSLTAMTTLEIVRRIEAGDVLAGFRTPSLQYGADFILQFAHCARQDLE